MYSVMLVIILVALWAVAARHPNAITTAAVFTATIGVLGIATLLAIAHRDDRRFFWRGFIVCGYLYFFFAFGPILMSNDAPHFLPEVLLNDLWFLWASDGTSGDTYFMHTLSQQVGSSRAHFVKNSHALLTILVALCGGFIARFIAARDDRR
jgi:hypothetical protein